MKKRLATFLLCTSITTMTLADWHFENFGEPFTVAHGVTYTPISVLVMKTQFISQVIQSPIC